jgi:hypothetical protein
MAVGRRAAARRGNVLSRLAATGDIHSCVMRYTFGTKIAQKNHFGL